MTFISLKAKAVLVRIWHTALVKMAALCHRALNSCWELSMLFIEKVALSWITKVWKTAVLHIFVKPFEKVRWPSIVVWQQLMYYEHPIRVPWKVEPRRLIFSMLSSEHPVLAGLEWSCLGWDLFGWTSWRFVEFLCLLGDCIQEIVHGIEFQRQTFFWLSYMW